MLRVRPAQERGYADRGWLKSWHSFSFADYHDPQHMGWGNLRVINEDWIAPGTGFGLHGHRDMEIISYVLAGELAHQDNLGHASSIPAGDVQHMSAGRGVMHSEFNHSPNAVTHLLQIWITPHSLNLAPRYAQKHFGETAKQGQLCLLAAPDGRLGSVPISADARLYSGLFEAGQTAQLALPPQRKGYVHLVRGSLEVNGVKLSAGDAALLENEACIHLAQGRAAEVLVFDLAPG